jgi:hypothetical protein
MSLQNTPPFLRYFKARIQPFTKPVVWGSALVVLLGALAVWQYRNNPDWLSNDPETPKIASEDAANTLAESGLSPDELAAASELDSLELLSSEVEQNQSIPVIPSAVTPSQSSQKKNNQEKPKTEENTPINLENPFIKQLNQPISRNNLNVTNRNQSSFLNLDDLASPSQPLNNLTSLENQESPLARALREADLQNANANNNQAENLTEANSSNSESSSSDNNIAQQPVNSVNPYNSLEINNNNNNNIYTNNSPNSNFQNPQNFAPNPAYGMNYQSNFGVTPGVSPNFTPGQNFGTNVSPNLNQPRLNTSSQNAAQGFTPLIPPVNTSNPSLRSNLRPLNPNPSLNNQVQPNYNQLTPPITSTNPRLNSNLRNP